MLDVHPPHKAIGGTGEFFLHLFTITIGLLIAVGIEGCVERYEHHKLAEEARQTMTAEIRENAKSAGALLTAIDQQQKRNADELTSVQKIQLAPNDPAAQDLNLSLNYSFVGFNDTAWKTAQATGALGFMPYAEAERFSDIYGGEEMVLRGQDQIAEDQTQMLGVAREVHPAQRKLSSEDANTVAKQLGILQGHLLTLKLAARVLQAEQEAYLEGKEAPHTMSGTQ